MLSNVLGHGLGTPFFAFGFVAVVGAFGSGFLFNSERCLEALSEA